MPWLCKYFHTQRGRAYDLSNSAEILMGGAWECMAGLDVLSE